jgi:hypothetical protein
MRSPMRWMSLRWMGARRIPTLLLGTARRRCRERSSRRTCRLMKARQKLGVPLILASCKTCGTNGSGLTRDMCLEIAEEEASGSEPGLDLQRAGQGIEDAVAEGRITALPNAPRFRRRSSSRATSWGDGDGADDRLWRTAPTSFWRPGHGHGDHRGVPIAKGIPAGPAWHGAKIAECGANAPWTIRRAASFFI